MFSCEVYVDRISKIGHFCSDHIGRPIRNKGLVAVLTSVSLSLFDNLPPTVFTHTSGIEDPLIVLYPGYVTIQKIKVILISIIFLLQSVINLADHIEVA